MNKLQGKKYFEVKSIASTYHVTHITQVVLVVKNPPASALQITEKRRETKGKREKEIYTHLNAEFQRIARRDKEAFLSYQCKEIEENSRMGKIRDLFKKNRDTKGTFHTKMNIIKEEMIWT